MAFSKVMLQVGIFSTHIRENVIVKDHSINLTGPFVHIIQRIIISVLFNKDVIILIMGSTESEFPSKFRKCCYGIYY